MKSIGNIDIKSNHDLDVAKDVLKKEIEGLEALIKWLGDDFIKAINLIYSTKGRIILSGMGKSGHIAKKIAATLSSVGTPSFFVHPGEASHGDLGMITEEDVVILLSNSGETIELKDLINYCKRFSVPIIAIVRRKKSILVSAANVALILPDIEEVCSLKAPTTSTTMMLALGDAIAVTLLKKMNFSKEEYNIYHPGGQLGKTFMHVKNLMHEGDELPISLDDNLMSEVLIEMSTKSFGCSGVIDKDGRLIGMVTDGDLRRSMQSDFTNLLVSDVMTKDPITIDKNAFVTEALSIMQKKSITALFILDSYKKPIGLIHIHDILRAGVF